MLKAWGLLFVCWLGFGFVCANAQTADVGKNVLDKLKDIIVGKKWILESEGGEYGGGGGGGGGDIDLEVDCKHSFVITGAMISFFCNNNKELKGRVEFGVSKMDDVEVSVFIRASEVPDLKYVVKFSRDGSRIKLTKIQNEKIKLQEYRIYVAE